MNVAFSTPLALNENPTYHANKEIILPYFKAYLDGDNQELLKVEDDERR